MNEPSESLLRLGTRGSPLARWQARWVRDRLLAAHPGLDVTLEIVRTSAEKFPDRPVETIGVGIFTREIDEALLRGEFELAIHSLKDVPSEIPDEIVVAAVLERESPLDAFVSPHLSALDDLPPGARIGTGSPRRKAQILARRPDLEVVPLRGNVDTRLRKMREEGLAGTVLALAGLRRLGREDAVTQVLDTEIMLPAVSQGAVGVCTRRDDTRSRGLAAPLEHAESRRSTDAERSFLRTLRGGCQVPAGALARSVGGRLHLEAIIASPDGTSSVRGSREGDLERPAPLGEALAAELLERGGGDILTRLREAER
ncbi:MAG: hydroxymethylbilane synthase [Planctomycetota bacterium]|nr:hydroxymethylbilane synthase [Planctomycetota bacterium]